MWQQSQKRTIKSNPGTEVLPQCTMDEEARAPLLRGLPRNVMMLLSCYVLCHDWSIQSFVRIRVS